MSDAYPEPAAASGADWGADLYAEHSAHHRAYDDSFLSRIHFEQALDALDIGCGTGALARRVSDLVGAGRVVGVDSSASMIERARRETTNDRVEFHLFPAEELGARFGSRPCFDLVLSKAALHWVPRESQAGLAVAMRRLIRPGGQLRLEFGGYGQIADVRRILDSVSSDLGGITAPWFFPSAEEYRQILVDAGWTNPAVKLVTQPRSFPDGASFSGWLESQVLNAYAPSLSRSAAQVFRERAVARCRDELRNPDGTFDRTYVRLDVYCRSD